MSDVEAIVVGSGYGGAVAALRLAEAGVETVVLERGRSWAIADPTRNATFTIFEQPDGRAEWLNGDGVTRTPAYEGTPIEKYTGTLEVLALEHGGTFLAGAGVGGGSLVYGGILIQPPGKLFRQVFPAAVGYDEMDRVYFPRVRSVVKTGPIPDDVLDSDYYLGLRVLCDQARKAGFTELESETEFRDGLARFQMAVDWDIVRQEIAGQRVPSVIAAEFWYGNNSGGKQSLDMDYLPRAEATGKLSLRPLHVVTDISRQPDGGYAVAYEIIDERGDVQDRRTLTCEYLFLAAGTFPTTKLLMRAKARGALPNLSAGLGEGVGNDGDIFLIRANIPELTNPHLGGPGAIAICNYENPILPCVMMRAPLPRFADDYPDKNAMGTFVFTHTDKRGRLTYDAGTDTLDLHFTPESADAALHLANRLNDVGGGEVVAVTAGITGHQLGGACMDVVCDTEGRVNGHPHLYVVDGSLLPGSSTCVNPAFTIAAVAERCLEHILAEDLRR